MVALSLSSLARRSLGGKRREALKRRRQAALRGGGCGAHSVVGELKLKVNGIEGTVRGVETGS